LKPFTFVLLSIAAALSLSGCSPETRAEAYVSSAGEAAEITSTKAEEPAHSEAETRKASNDSAAGMPNEAGAIMVVMFHNFARVFARGKNGGGEYTTTFYRFERLLSELYDGGYRLAGVRDYLENDISVAAGRLPIVFTFDDSTPGQFHLVEDEGKLVAAEDSAVGIMEEFQKLHPEFGLKGAFYISAGLPMFQGAGTESERLQYLVAKGFELGNHTLHHVRLNEIADGEKIIAEVGGNQKRVRELVPGYTFLSLSLPFGQAAKHLVQYVVKGEFEGVPYENLGLFDVGSRPAPSPATRRFDPLSIPRVRASGAAAVKTDFAFWMRNLSLGDLYVSDGDAATVTVPKALAKTVDPARLLGKRLVTY